MATKKPTSPKKTSAPKRLTNVAALLAGTQPAGSAPAGKPVTDNDLIALRRNRENEDKKIKKKLSQPKGSDEVESATSPVRKFLAQAMERFHLAAEATANTRQESLDDLRFSVGEQWSQEIKGRRELDQRPCLTINRIKTFIRLVTNEQRQQRPAIQVNPVGSGADTDTAKIFQGIIRHIEINSDAEVAYDDGGESAVRIGFGYWRIVSEYLPMSFDQELKIKRVKNPFTVYFDPDCIEHDYSDAKWCFIIEDMSKDEYMRQHPDTNIAGLSDMSSIGDHQEGWVTRTNVRVAEYFYVVETEQTLYQLDGGKTVYEEDLPEGIDEETTKNLPQRQDTKREVKWAKISALDCLDGGPEKEIVLETRYIPVVPVLGDDLIVDGKHYLAGMVRDAKDPQRMYNYWVSAATETIALAPKAPIVVAVGQIEDFEEIWRTANVRNYSYLPYKPVDIQGQQVPPPQRQVVEPPIQAMGSMVRQADADLKGTIGLYDASLGQNKPDESGKAILARQKQGDVATLNYSDNQARAIRHTGRILVDWIPKKYDAPRIQRIINPDQSVNTTGVFNSKSSNKSPEDALTELQGIDPNIKRIYDLGVGIYDVTVSVGPSYQSKRQEAVASMMTLVSSYPQLMQIAGDLLIENMDWPGAEAIAARLKKQLPPNLLDADSSDPQIKLAALQSQMQVMMGQHDALVKELQQATDIIKTKKLDLESKERIANLQAQVQMLIAQAKVNADAGMEAMRGEFAAIQQRLDHLHEGISLDAELAHDMAIAQLPPQPPPVGTPGQGGGTPNPQGA